MQSSLQVRNAGERKKEGSAVRGQKKKIINISLKKRIAKNQGRAIVQKKTHAGAGHVNDATEISTSYPIS